jgi:hypothetical protein
LLVNIADFIRQGEEAKTRLDELNNLDVWYLLRVFLIVLPLALINH